MTKQRPYQQTLAREAALVDAQCLIQRALNETYGNPRDDEEADPEETKSLFKRQLIGLSKKLDRPLRHVEGLLSDESNMRLKFLAETLSVLGYDLKLDIVKRVE